MGVGVGWEKGGHVPPTYLIGGGGAMVCLWPPLLTPHFYFPLELYVYIPINYLVDNFNNLTQMAVSK